MAVRGDPDPAERYRAVAAAHGAEAHALELRARRLSVLRLASFLGGVLPLLLAAELPGPAGAWRGAGLAILALFAVLVIRHRHLRDTLTRAITGRDLALHGAARVERRWRDLPTPVVEPAAAGEDHPYARDLDVFGAASLRSLLGPVFTPMGHRTLDGWLLAPGPADGVEARQEAARELVGEANLRESVAVEGALLDPVAPGVLDGFLDWLEEPRVVGGTRLALLRWAMPLATAVAVALNLAGLAPPGYWVAMLVAQAVVAWRAAPRIHAFFGRASSGVPGLRRYHRILVHWEGLEADAPRLAALVAALHGGGDAPASSRLRRLEGLLDAADARFSSMLHGVVATVLLWDVHVAARLEAWRAAEGAHVPAWLDALGELEALSALATLAADHPGWAWPTCVDTEPPVLRAVALGHPLLTDERCVRNDVEVGPPGTVLLVTGSNMSGKSTLLRSMGAAVVLGRAGGPVCAESLLLPPLRIFTSMQVRDSLEEGVSLFMAELERLRGLLDAAPPRDATDEAPLLYLVDEVLHGTNSEERRIAGRRLIRHLLRRRAVGAVTTHDLELHRDPEVEASAVLVHFRESVAERAGGERGLDFDYRLRPGLATTRNALLLAERVGLTEPTEPLPEPPAG